MQVMAVLCQLACIALNLVHSKPNVLHLSPFHWLVCCYGNATGGAAGDESAVARPGARVHRPGGAEGPHDMGPATRAGQATGTPGNQLRHH